MKNFENIPKIAKLKAIIHIFEARATNPLECILGIWEVMYKYPYALKWAYGGFQNYFVVELEDAEGPSIPMKEYGLAQWISWVTKVIGGLLKAYSCLRWYIWSPPYWSSISKSILISLLYG